MPRDIKFRAWDKDNKEMIYQSENTTKANGIMEAQFSFDEIGAYIFTRKYGEKAWREVKHFELMQYTGLQDKNGKEIYEGDIVKYKIVKEVPSSRAGLVKIEDGGYINAEIVWSISEWCTKTADGRNRKTLSMWHNAVTTKWEVVGNVYENPELIEKAQA